MRKGTIIAVVAIVLGLAFSVVAEERVFLTLSSGSPGGVYYPLGGGMAVVLQKEAGFRAAAESTGASVENSRLVGTGQSDMGMVMGGIGYKARNGLAPFERKFPIVSLFQMYPAPQHIVALKGSGIKSLADFKGKRISIDVPGSGSAVTATAILEVAGFNLEKDLTIANLSQMETIQALKDRKIDGAMLNFAYPAAAIVDLATVRDIELIPLEDSLLDKLTKKYPYFIKTVIPAGTYKGVDYDTAALGDSNLMIANEKMGNDLAYKIVKTIFENVDKGKWRLIDVHPIAKQLTPQNAVNSPIPLHPGAVKYFKEVGALK